jgi:hypothetical protein
MSDAPAVTLARLPLNTMPAITSAAIDLQPGRQKPPTGSSV